MTHPEAPSGKGAADENFPVGSWLIAKPLRPHIARFYAFARTIDDVADNPDLPAEEKIRRLEGFGAALDGRPPGPGYEKAVALRQSLEETGVPVRHGQDLISAFCQDARQARYASWADLIDYCDRSAAPVGRYLLDLHGEDRQGYAAADALSNALQVINHCQDLREDARLRDRIYLPQDWMAEAGATDADLLAPALSPALRRVVNRCLDGCDTLMAEARSLPGRLRSRRLAWESAVIVAIADRLIGRLRREDPLATRVELSKPEAAWTALTGLVRYR